MQWEEFFRTLSRYDRIRLLRWLEEGRQYANLAARGREKAEVEQVVQFIDQAVDALIAARLMLPVPTAPQPWESQAYRAYRTHFPATNFRVRPAELSAIREAAGQAAAQGTPAARAAPLAAGQVNQTDAPPRGRARQGEHRWPWWQRLRPASTVNPPRAD